MTDQCKSYRSGETICADGFVQKPFCSGQGGCWACGNLAKSSIPYCLRDESPKHMVADNGAPRFYPLKEQSGNE